MICKAIVGFIPGYLNPKPLTRPVGPPKGK